MKTIHFKLKPLFVGSMVCILLFLGLGCGQLENFSDATDDKYHKLSFNPPNSIDITIKGHASDAMVAFYNSERKSNSEEKSAKSVLQRSRSELNKHMQGRARELWNGTYSAFGYHPNIGKGFRDEEWSDLRDAIRDLKSRNHKCLCITWKPTGTNWTTRAAGGNCQLGSKLK